MLKMAVENRVQEWLLNHCPVSWGGIGSNNDGSGSAPAFLVEKGYIVENEPKFVFRNLSSSHMGNWTTYTDHTTSAVAFCLKVTLINAYLWVHVIIFTRNDLGEEEAVDFPKTSWKRWCDCPMKEKNNENLLDVWTIRDESLTCLGTPFASNVIPRFTERQKSHRTKRPRREECLSAFSKHASEKDTEQKAEDDINLEPQSSKESQKVEMCEPSYIHTLWINFECLCVLCSKILKAMSNPWTTTAMMKYIPS
jgi:hypothetical protein